MQELLIISLLLAVVLYWWDSAYANELALKTSRYLCNRANYQLLDETVLRQRIWLGRNEYGRLQIRRIFSFDYTDGEGARYQGYVVTLGRRVAEASLNPRHVNEDD